MAAPKKIGKWNKYFLLRNSSRMKSNPALIIIGWFPMQFVFLVSIEKKQDNHDHMQLINIGPYWKTCLYTCFSENATLV